MRFQFNARIMLTTHTHSKYEQFYYSASSNISHKIFEFVPSLVLRPKFNTFHTQTNDGQFINWLIFFSSSCSLSVHQSLSLLFCTLVIRFPGVNKRNTFQLNTFTKHISIKYTFARVHCAPTYGAPGELASYDAENKLK